MSLRKQTPSDFLKQIIGRPVVVKLNSGVDYRGNDAIMSPVTLGLYHTRTMQNKCLIDPAAEECYSSRVDIRSGVNHPFVLASAPI